MQLEDDLAGLGVEVGGGLVGEDDGGLGDEGPGDGHALALAAGEVVGLLFDLLLQAHFLDHALGPVPDLLFGELFLLHDEEGELDVFPRREHRNEVEGLKDEPDGVQAKVGELPVGHGGDVPAVDIDRALGGVIDAADDVEERGFAAPRRPDNGDEIALFDGEVDSAHRVNRRGA